MNAELTAEAIWKKYENCKNYVGSKSIVANTQKYWNFYLGNQWDGIKSGDEKLPFLNFIMPVIKHKVGTVCQNNMTAHYSDLKGREEYEAISKALGEQFSALWERGNMDILYRAVIKNAAIVGDGYAYFGTEEIEDAQVIQNTSVLLGDEQNQNIQEQPYIILRQRLFVKDIRAIALENEIDPAEIERITADDDTDYLVMNKEDVSTSNEDGKTTSVIYFERIDGVIHCAKAVRNCIYEPLRPIASEKPNGKVDVPLTLYPLVNMVWEDVPNVARGQGETSIMIPNQIEVNKTIARRSMSVKMTAFPRLAYDSASLMNPEALEKVGASIELNGGGAQSVNQMISYIPASPMSGDAKALQDDILNTTRDLTGASDVNLGQIDPTRVASSALTQLRDQSNLSLTEQETKSKQFVEDVARLQIQLWAVYHPDGITVVSEDIDPETGDKTEVGITITPEQLNDFEPDVRVDVSQDTPWSRQAELDWLKEVLTEQHITFEEYAKLLPDNGSVPKNKLMKLLAARPAMPQEEPEETEEVENELPEMQQ